MAGSPLIAIEGVSRRYVTTSGAVDALRDVSLSVEAGEFGVDLLGPGVDAATQAADAGEAVA